MRATRWVLLSVVVGLCCLSVAPALASDARLEALSVQREYVEDYFNFRTFPTVVARYQNLVQVGLGSRSGSSFGDDKSVGVIGAGDGTSYGVFALYLNEVNRSGVEQQQLDLSWAKAFSTTTIGATVLYTNSEIKDNTGDKETPINGSPGSLDNPNANFFGFNAGVKIDMSGNSMLEIAAGLGFYGWDDTLSGPGTHFEDDGKVSYLISARIFSEVTDRTTLVPLLKYQKMDLTSKPPSGGTSTDYTRTMINLGIALHYEVNGNDLLILGLSVDNIKDKDGTDEMSAWSTPNLFAALEFDVYSWLTARAGVTKGFENTNLKDTATTSELDIKDSSYQFGLGMGLHFDHFDVDATVDPEALFTGGYFLSGESSQPLTRITATYYF